MTEPLSEILKNISAEELLRMLAGGLNNTTGNRMNQRDVALEQGVREYHKLVEFNLAPKSVESIKTANRLLLKYISGDKIVSSINKKVADNVVMKMAETAPRGIKTYLRTINAEFNVFVEWDYTPINPFQKIKLLKRQKEDPKIFTDGEITQLKEILIKKEKSVIGEMVVFSVNTGLRGGEITKLRWGDIDFKGKKLNVGSKHHKTKSAKIRVIPFNKTVEEILIENSKRQIANGKIIREFVFTQSNGKPYQLDTISKQLKKAIRESGLDEDLHWHSLRHTAATNLVNKGVPLPVVKQILGHADIKTTMIYVKTDLESLRDAVNRL